jgi:outer membrane protein assembly factor BamB
MRYRLLISVFIAVAAFPLATSAQVGSSALISHAAARQLGLERMWFTQLDLDRSKGRLAGLHLHISNTESHTVFEIVHEGKRYVFSQRDRNPFGEELGVEGAKQKADEKLAQITKELEAAGKKDGPPITIQTHVVPKITLYATSERGTIHAVDAETGRTRWSVGIGKPGFPTTAPAANEKQVAACNGSTLYVLLAEDGKLSWSRQCVSAPGAGPAMSDELIFVPMITGQIESMLVDDPKRPLATYKSYGRALVQPVLSYNSVAWPTDSGNLYVGLAHGQGMRFRLQAKDAITSPPAFLAPDKVFATSLDGYIYCVNENRGNVLWRFSTGEAIYHSPVALGSTVYAITDRGNLFAIDAATAAEIWTVGGIRRYVAGNEKRLYCIDTRGDLTILDAATGSRLGTIFAGQIDFPFLNVQTDRILLVTSTGMVQCLRESNLSFPVTHYRFEVKKAVQPAKTTTPRAGDKTEPTPTPGKADPFADPFGAPAPKSAPPAAEQAVDPFAPPK